MYIIVLDFQQDKYQLDRVTITPKLMILFHKGWSSLGENEEICCVCNQCDVVMLITKYMSE